LTASCAHSPALCGSDPGSHRYSFFGAIFTWDTAKIPLLRLVGQKVLATGGNSIRLFSSRRQVRAVCGLYPAVAWCSGICGCNWLKIKA